MKKAIASILLAALIVLPLAAEDITPTISVSGSAEVSVKPDTAYFSISASFVADTSEEARKLASGTISSAIEILTSEYGVEKEDIVTENLSINPEYKWKYHTIPFIIFCLIVFAIYWQAQRSFRPAFARGCGAGTNHAGLATKK